MGATMELESNTYMLYGIFFIFILLGLLFTVAKRLGSSKNFPTPKENREREEKKEMTPAQIAEAQKLAREWMEVHGKK